MTPAEHRDAAERLRERAQGLPLASPARLAIIAEAQLHATLSAAPAPRRPRKPASSEE